MKDLLAECRAQLEYLNGKFQETGTTNALLARINTELSKPEPLEAVKKVYLEAERKGAKDDVDAYDEGYFEGLVEALGQLGVDYSEW